MKLHERIEDVSECLVGLSRRVLAGSIDQPTLRAELDNLAYETEDVARRLKRGFPEGS